uniref:Regulator of MON1-CCZ1 complex isoform 4-like n=1 Tax=Sus scrofa TaxID=9823 RepID=A0A480Q0H4_PIG
MCRVTSLAARPADARRVLTSAAFTCALVSGKWPGLCLWQFPHEPPLGLSFWFTSHCLPPLGPGYLWNLQVKLQPIVNLLPDKGRLMDFLLQRRDCKMVILSVCAQMLTESDRATLPVIATVFDKLNQEYKKYLDAEQSYTMAMEAGQSRSSPLLRRPVRTQAVVDQSDMYTHVLSAFTEKKETPHKFVVAVLMEYIRSLNQFQITVQVLSNQHLWAGTGGAGAAY